jgi:RNA polymerase sigma factor (sigma-70 family)
MTSIVHSDSCLARRVANGDGDAFTMLDQRHRRALTHYAGSLLRRSEHDAEDIAQEVLIRAHLMLRGGHVPDDLRPWLYRLTRNRAIDELRRKRWTEHSLDPERAPAFDERAEPVAALARKEAVRGILEDIGKLPARQRAALVARELDGTSAEQVAAQLGVSVTAMQKLATRARVNLVKTRAARDADCGLIRTALLDAHERGVRSTEHGLRHMKDCNACRGYQRELRTAARMPLAA